MYIQSGPYNETNTWTETKWLLRRLESASALGLLLTVFSGHTEDKQLMAHYVLCCKYSTVIVLIFHTQLLC